MYIPRQFIEHDRDRLFDLMRSNNFGILITVADHTPQITHLPFLIDAEAGPNGVLYGHFARANPHWKTLNEGQPALAIFQGPHCYVSPGWYADQSNVPTWNYTVVHSRGTLELLQEKSAVLDIVSRLTEVHEQGKQNPWQVGNAGKHLDKLLKAIVGFRIRIDTLDGKFKLSQNRSVSDQQGVIGALSNSADAGEYGVAKLMREKRRIDKP